MRGSSVARLQGLRFRIPPGAWMSVSYGCCVFSGRDLCVGPITCPECPAERGVSECDREAWIMRRPWPNGGCCAMEKKIER